MTIQKINASQPLKPGFKAQITIEAPRGMLSGRDREYLTKLGKKIGTDDDIIEIKLGKLENSKVDPGVKSYKMTAVFDSKRDNGRYSKKAESSLLYSYNDEVIEKNRPKLIIKRFLDSISKSI